MENTININVILPILGSVLIVVIGFILNRWLDRTARLRQLKLDIYMNFLKYFANFGVNIPEIPDNNEIRGQMVEAYNKLGIVGSTDILAISKNIMRMASENKWFEEENIKNIRSLIYYMRKDLKMKKYKSPENADFDFILLGNQEYGIAKKSNPLEEVDIKLNINYEQKNRKLPT